MLRTIINAEPVGEIRSMEEMFDRFFGQPTRPMSAPTTLPVDITERDGSFFVRAAVPGVDPNELQVTVENNVLSIQGEIKNEITSDNEKVYRREVSYGSFSRSIRLPEKLNLDEIQADFNNGLVTIKIPRLPEVKPQVVKVEVKSAGTLAEPQG